MGSRDRGLRGDGGAQRRRGPQTVELLSRIAEIEERRLSHQNAAFDVYGRALRVDPNNQDVLAHLERLAAETGHWAKLATLLASEIEKVDEPRRAIDLLLRLARIYEEETGQLEEAIATYRRADRRPIPTASRRWSRSIACTRAPSSGTSWPTIVRARDPDRADRRGPRRADLPARADLRAGAGRHAEGRRGLPRHPDRRSDARRDARRAGADVHGRHDAARDRRRPRAALPRRARSGRSCTGSTRCSSARLTDVGERQTLLRRLAEIAEHKLVDQVAAFGWWAEAVKEDPSSEQALDELLRLARATHQWDAYVTTMIGRGVARARRRPSGATCCCGWRPASRTTSATWSAPRSALVQVLSEHEKDPAALASLDRIYESQGMYENLAGDPAPAARRSPTTAPSWSTLNLRLGRVYAEALEEIDPAIASYLAVLEHESRSRDALDALERLYFRSERWPELYGVYEKLVDVAKDDERAWPTATRAWRSSPPTRSTIAPRRSSCGAASSTSAARTPSRCRAWPICTRWPGEWKELTEVLEKQVVATPDPEARIPIYKRLGRIWGEKLSRERNSLESWQKVLEIDPQDVDALRAIAANYKSAGAWEELSQSLRRLIQVGQLGGSGIERDELKELFSQLGELEGDTLMRTQDAIDAWREVLELDAADFRALAALERLFMQEARWEEAVDILERRAQALASPNDRVDVLMQAASLWADKIGDGGSAARGLRARAADRSGPPAGVDRAGAALSPAQELGEAGRPAAGAHRVLARRGGAHRAAGAGRRRSTSSSSTIATARS